MWIRFLKKERETFGIWQNLDEIKTYSQIYWDKMNMKNVFSSR